MDYPFILKFSALNNLSDARYAAGMWADFTGFCFDPSDASYIEPGKAKEISSWINGPLLCGEFGTQPVEWILDFVKSLKLDAIQIPAGYPFPEIYDNANVKFIVLADNASIDELPSKADIFICRDNEIYKRLKIISDKPVILETEDLDLDASLYDGIAFKGGIEDKPGTRNQLEWTAFLEKWVNE